MFCLRLAISILLALSCQTAVASPRSVSSSRQGVSTYASALSAYHDKRTKDAVRQLKAILQREPLHEEAALLLGTIYFENDRLKKARSYFERVNPSDLTQESAFAYGMTYLQYKSYKKAVKGFRYEVKQRGPERTLAIYYLGVIYFKNGQILRAKRFFQALDPHDLPVYLRVNRRHYLSEIRREQNRMVERLSGYRSGRSFEKRQARPSEEAEKRDSEGGDDDLRASLGKDQRDEYQAGWQSSVRPALVLAQQGATLDNSNLALDTVNLFAHKEAVTGLFTYRPPQKGNGLSLQLMSEAGHSGYSAKVQKSRYFVIDQVSGAFSEQEDQKKSESAGYGHLSADVSLGLSNELSFEAGASYLAHMPNFASEKMWGQSAARVGLKVEGKRVDFTADVSVQQPFDAKQDKDAIDQIYSLGLEYDFQIFRLELEAYYWTTDHVAFVNEDRFRYTLVDPSLRYRVGFASEAGGTAAVSLNLGEASVLASADYYDRDIAKSRFVSRVSTIDNIETAVDGANKFLLMLSYPFWDTLTVFGSAGYNVLSAYLYETRDSDGNVTRYYLTDVDQQVLQGGATVAFSDWIRLTGTYAFINNNYVHKDAREYDFQVANPKEIEDFSFYFELAKTF